MSQTSPTSPIVRLFERSSSFVSFVLIGTGSIVLMGWCFGIPALIGGIFGSSPMRPLTALATSSGGLALVILNTKSRKSFWMPPITMALSCLVVLIGVVSLLNKTPGLEEFLRISSSPVPTPASAGTMSSASAITVTLLGTALLLMCGTERWINAGQLIALMALVVVLLPGLGYVYGAGDLLQTRFYSMIGVLTVLSLAFLSAGILFVRPGLGIMKTLSGDEPGSVALRRVLPVVVIGPVFLGWLRLTGERSGYYDASFGVAIMTLSNILLVAGALYFSARSTNKSRAILEQSNFELKLAEDKFRTTLDHMLEGCQIIGYDWRYLYLNAAAEKHNRRPNAELLGKKYMDMWPGIEATEVWTVIRRCMEERLPHRMENEFTFPNGSKGWFALKLEPVPEGIFILSEDITKEKQLSEELKKHHEQLENLVVERTSQLEAAIKELEAFSYSVSHDLRAPLRHIDGFVELFHSKESSGLSPAGRRYLDIISEAARKMGNLIDDLLSFSRMGRVEMMKSRVDMNALVRDAIAELKAQINGRVVHWNVGDLSSVTGDASMIRQVWANLLSNALKYSSKKDESIIEVGSRVEHEEFIFYVKDNGVGFDMQYAPKLFGVFQRLHNTRDFEGTGVGLANVRRIVTRHGGRTWATGEVGKGASVYFTVPIQSPEDAS
ncbi:MAG TPA: ATP-binding protein [Bacteroidota bacterium]|nr:ATP-binding protein [Bacteroidota bacterium]